MRRQNITAYGRGMAGTGFALPVRAKPRAGSSKFWPLFRILTAPLLIVGVILHGLVYSSIQPAIVIVILGAPIWIIMSFFPKYNLEKWTYSWIFSFYWFCASMVSFFEGPTQISYRSIIDAEKFYTFLSTQVGQFSLFELKSQVDGSFAVFIWGRIYDFLSSVGIEHQPYIGITVNVILMAAAAAVSMRIFRYVSGDNRENSVFVPLLFSVSGLFMLFSALHIRDSFAVFFISLLSLIWVRYLERRSFFNLVSLLLATPIFCGVLFFIRDEFVFVPMAFAVAGIGSLAVSNNIRKSEAPFVKIILAIGVILFVAVLALFGGSVLERLNKSGEAYQHFAEEASGQGSLGMAVFVNQPLIVKVIIGPAYTMLMPIPFWIGLVSGDSYLFFKSIGAVFAFFFVPCLVAAILTLYKIPATRRASLLFLLSSFIGMLLLIGVTSAEGRHMGAFLPSAIVAVSCFFGTQPFSTIKRQCMFVFLCMIAAAHVAWIGLKLL